MSDAPRRQLGNLSALDRMKGAGSVAPVLTTAAPPPEPQPVAASEPSKLPVKPVSAPQEDISAQSRPMSHAKAPKVSPKLNPATQGRSQKMSVYIAPAKRDWAKAAYRATSHLEGEPTFSEFVSAAIEREVQRRERLYNDGQPYVGDSGPLTAGRPLS